MIMKTWRTMKKLMFNLVFALMYVVFAGQAVMGATNAETPMGMYTLATLPFTWMAIMVARYMYIRANQNNGGQRFQNNHRPNNNFRRN